MRYTSKDDLHRAFHHVYVSYEDKVYYTAVDGLNILLYDENSNHITTVNARQEFHLGFPSLGFVPRLKRWNAKTSLVFCSRRPNRQWTFGVKQGTLSTVGYCFVRHGEPLYKTNLPTEVIDGCLWPMLQNKYLPAKDVLVNGGGLSKDYGVTAEGVVVFANDIIGFVTEARDGIALLPKHKDNSIILQDLNGIGVKKICEYEKEN